MIFPPPTPIFFSKNFVKISQKQRFWVFLCICSCGQKSTRASRKSIFFKVYLRKHTFLSSEKDTLNSSFQSFRTVNVHFWCIWDIFCTFFWDVLKVAYTAYTVVLAEWDLACEKNQEMNLGICYFYKKYTIRLYRCCRVDWSPRWDSN